MTNHLWKCSVRIEHFLPPLLGDPPHRTIFTDSFVVTQVRRTVTTNDGNPPVIYLGECKA